MLREIHAEGVGLTGGYDLPLGDRVNIFTGDNGLGKSFVLDLSWWCLTGTWFGNKAFPQRGTKLKPRIVAELSDSEGRPDSMKSEFDRETQTWGTTKQSEALPDIVIYAGTDGRFGVWDRLRARLSSQEQDQMPFYGSQPAQRIIPTYLFDNKTIWEGLRDPSTSKVRCKGFLQDVSDWQNRPTDIRHAGFAYLSEALRSLSVSDETMGLGEVTRLFVDDVREIPTIRFSYGSVPIVLCSSAVQRIAAFAYLMVWAWKEHMEAAEIMGLEPGKGLVLIIDEVELHLHPKWQREILPAIMRTASILSKAMRTQVIATTHSPLVLASVEPFFNEEVDSLFLFSEEERTVKLEKIPLIREGAVDSWLQSEVFALQEPRSIQAEHAIVEAEAYLRGESDKSADEIEEQLKLYLPSIDPFVARWLLAREKGKL